MNFFKSVFSDDPEPSDSQSNPSSPLKSQSNEHDDPYPDSSSDSEIIPDSNPDISTITNAWSFGSSLIKTLASKSESVIETYRRDLEEFGTGLRKETAVIREVASRAVKDLPTSLEAGAAAAQESLESVGQAIDNLGNTVSEIISHGKDSILADDSDGELSETRQIGGLNLDAKPYSRFDVQIGAIQGDVKTYCEEPEDLEEYNEWKLGFVLEEKADEIESLFQGNGVVEEMYAKVVPSKVDDFTFWSRYFYKVYKVKKSEELRAKLVKSAMSGEEEEALTWDVDDDDYEENDKLKTGLKIESEDVGSSEKKVDDLVVPSEENDLKRENDDSNVPSESKNDSVIDEKNPLVESQSSADNLESKSDEKVCLEVKTDNGASSKDSEFSVVSSQQLSPEEEDLEWDEIEDIEKNDDVKVSALGSPSRADLRKRLSAAEDEEDLCWDIEDDDDDDEEPVKS